MFTKKLIHSMVVLYGVFCVGRVKLLSFSVVVN